jgi:hypothetical protein
VSKLDECALLIQAVPVGNVKYCLFSLIFRYPTRRTCVIFTVTSRGLLHVVVCANDLISSFKQDGSIQSGSLSFYSFPGVRQCAKGGKRRSLGESKLI